MEKFLKGEILTADKLNELVKELNSLSEDNNVITGSSTASGQSDYVAPKFTKPEFHDMHDADGIPVILDQLTGLVDNNGGLYARPIEATTYTSQFTARGNTKKLNLLTNDVKSSQSVYQKIVLDAKGNVSGNELLLVDACSGETPSPFLPSYTENKPGVIYRRMGRVDVNCKINGVEDISKKYKVIYTPEVNLPPFIANAKVGADDCSFQLVKPLDGNTYPIKGIKAGCNTQIEDRCNYLIISSTGGSGSGGGCCDDPSYPLYCGEEPILVCNTQIRLHYDSCVFDYDSYKGLTLKNSCGSDNQISCAEPPVIICGNQVRLHYNQNQFTYDSYRGLELSCALIACLVGSGSGSSVCVQEPLTYCGGTIGLSYNYCHFTTCNGRLELSYDILNRLGGSGCNIVYCGRKPIYVNESGVIALCANSEDFATCGTLKLKNPLKGIVNASGAKIPWSSLKGRTEPLFYFYVECTEIGIAATYNCGYLQMFGMNT